MCIVYVKQEHNGDPVIKNCSLELLEVLVIFSSAVINREHIKIQGNQMGCWAIECKDWQIMFIRAAHCKVLVCLCHRLTPLHQVTHFFLTKDVTVVVSQKMKEL